VNAKHAQDAEVPKKQHNCGHVNDPVELLEELGDVHVGEEEEEHKGGEGQPAVDELVEFVFVENNEYDRHNDDHGDEYGRVGNGHPELGAAGLRLLVERSVDSVR